MKFIKSFSDLSIPARESIFIDKGVFTGILFPMPEILLVNDDGIFSPGLRALAAKLCANFTCTIAAPSVQQSWIGKASSYHKSIPCKEVTVDGYQGYSIDGTPSDCASAGIYHLCSSLPELVVSGINAGANVGDAYILSSGTVGGALEGALAGIPSMAVGVEFPPEITKKIEFDPGEDDIRFFQFAAELTCRACKVLFSLPDLPAGKIININMDNSCTEKSRIISAMPERYNYGSFLRRDGDHFYHQGSPKDWSRTSRGSDMSVLKEGNIAVSLISLPGAGPAPQTWLNQFIEILSDGN